MTHIDLTTELAKLPLKERLLVIENTVRQIQTELHDGVDSPAGDGMRKQMSDAAQALLEDYQSDTELTAFTALDAEDFHAER